MCSCLAFWIWTVIHVICRRTTAEHEEHLENLKRLDLDPRYGLAGPGRFPEKDETNSSEKIKRRPGDWWLGLLVSYKGELIEEGMYKFENVVK